MDRVQFGRTAMADDAQSLHEKISALPAERLAEVEAFVDALERDRRLVQAAALASAPAFAKVWDNPEDAVYDAL